MARKTGWLGIGLTAAVAGCAPGQLAALLAGTGQAGTNRIAFGTPQPTATIGPTASPSPTPSPTPRPLEFTELPLFDATNLAGQMARYHLAYPLDVASYMVFIQDTPDIKPKLKAAMTWDKDARLKGKYESNVADLFEKLRISPEREGGYSKFLVATESVPIAFGLSREKTVLYCGPLVSDFSFNTLQNSLVKRVSKQAATGLAMAGKMAAAFPDVTEVDTFLASVIYGTRDFLNEAEYEARAEMVFYYFPVDVARKYDKGDLTAQAAMKESKVYVVPRKDTKAQLIDVDMSLVN